MQLTITGSGLLDPSRLNAWTSATQKRIHKAVATGMKEGGKVVAGAVRDKIRSSFKVKKASFTNSLTAKVYDSKPNRLPALKIGSKIPWLGIHARGGSISGKMLIPLTGEGKRLGPKAFKRAIDGLIRSGNAFFIKKGGQVILMAENLRENAAQLRRFKSAERQRTGVKRLQRGHEIPIAALVTRVTLKRRFDLSGNVRQNLPALANAIQKQLNAHGL